MSKIRPSTQLILPGDATKYLDGTGAFTTPAGGGGSSSPYLTVVSYAATNYSLASDGVSHNLDTTHLVVTFTAPASGRVIVGFDIPLFLGSPAAGTILDFRVADNTATVVQSATYRAAYYGTTFGTNFAFRSSKKWLMTSLTAGTSYTWYLNYQNTIGTAQVNPTSDGSVLLTVEIA